MKEKTNQLWNRNYVFVLILNMLSSISFYMVATILSKYLVGIGIALSTAGMIVGLFSLTSLCCRPFCGMLADRVDNVRLLKLSNLLMGIGLIGFAITDNLVLLILFRIINGVGFSISGTSQVALVSRFIPEGKTGEGIGYIGLGMVVASASAPGLGVLIAECVGIQMTFAAAAILTAISYLMLCLFRYEEAPRRSHKAKLRLGDVVEKKAVPYAIFGGAFSFINGVLAAYLLMFSELLDVSGISVYFTLYAACLLVVRPLSGKLTDRYGIKAIAFPATLLTVFSVVLLGISTTLPMILVSCVIRAIGQGAAQPTIQASCLDAVGKNRSGVATSTYYLGGDIGQGIGPIIGGFVISAIAGIQGYTVLFVGCAALLLLAGIYFYHAVFQAAAKAPSQ